MEYQTSAQEAFIYELTNSKIDVHFSGESFKGYPTWFPNELTYNIEKVEANNSLGLITNWFRPFSIIFNDEFECPLDFPFYGDPRYSIYFGSLQNNLITEIDLNIKMRFDVWSVLDYLSMLRFDLKEIRNGFSKKHSWPIEMFDQKYFLNSNIEPNIINNDSYSPYIGKYVDFSLSNFWNIQVDSIDLILKILESRIKNIKDSKEYYSSIQSTIISNKLLWNASDTDLLELIVALLETQSLSSEGKKLSRKELVEEFSRFFGREIKDFESKLTRATERKKDTSPYLTKLRLAFENYCQSKEERLK